MLPKKYFLFLIGLLFCLPIAANATHIYGADFYYHHDSGNHYTLTLVIYGDCSGGAFPSLASAVAEVNLFDDNLASPLVQTYYLGLTAPGVEVTPVCPSQINNTACNGGTLPGVARYIYSTNLTINYPSTGWRFRFTGSMGSTSSAGRSNNITNLAFAIAGGSSQMNLEAQLNNSVDSNSSPQFTTIPTPFYCINVAQQYNQGAVDPDGDSLSYSLVPALEPGGAAAYATGYSATAPLATSTGAFTFNSINGQMSFTPNLIQKSVVVNKVTEYRNGVIMGTAMREMTFIVANTCNGNPPTGLIDTTTGASAGGILISTTDFLMCYGTGAIAQFNIHPTDPELDTINVTSNGLPAGSTLNVTNNNTTVPTLTFTWNTTGVPAGNYTFYVTYKDFGCPLSHQQTIAYTIHLVRPPELSTTVTAPTQCVHRATLRYNLAYGYLPRTLVISQGATVLKTFIDNTGVIVDSLLPGTYTFNVSSSQINCANQYTVTIVDSGVYPFKPIYNSPIGYCLGDPPMQLTATPAPGASILWYTSSGTFLPIAPTPSTAAAGLTLYLVSQKYHVCESAKDTVKVYVTQRPIASIASPPFICTKDTASISFNGSIGVGPIIAYNWTWNGANYVQGTGAGPYRVKWDTPGVKTLTLQVFENLCPSAKVTQQITVKPTPKSIFSLPFSACLYDTVNVQYNTNALNGQQYAWDFAGAAIVQGSGAGPYRLHWTTEGIKHITLEVSLNGCIDTSSRDLIVHPSPFAHILNVPTKVCIADKIFLQATGGVNYVWGPEPRIFYEPDGAVYTYVMEPTTYVVSVKNQFGCISADSIRYTQIEPCCNFAYPTAFTPNNDGRNDTYHVITYGNQQEFEFSIYNRWGERLFYTFDPKATWNGTYNDKPCEIGTYFFYLKARCYTGHNEIHKGDFQLLR